MAVEDEHVLKEPIDGVKAVCSCRWERVVPALLSPGEDPDDLIRMYHRMHLMVVRDRAEATVEGMGIPANEILAWMKPPDGENTCE